MDNAQINKVRDRVAMLVGAVLALLGGFNIIHWDATQTALVVAASASLVMFAGSLTAHFKPGTQTEWPAVAMSFMAFVSSGLAALNAINVLNLTTSQIELVLGVVTAALGLAGIPVVRNSVTPITSVTAAATGAVDPLAGLAASANDPLAGLDLGQPTTRTPDA